MTQPPAPTSDPKEPMSATNRDPSSEASRVSMDLMSLVRLMVRHWRVTGPAAAATLALVVAAFVTSSPTYSASASVALYSPPEAPDAADTPGADPSAGQNPFARYGDLSVVADIVARRMDSDAERAALEAQGVTGYEVVANRLQRGPLIEVTGTGPNPAVAISSAEAVVAEFDSVLSEMQKAEGADPEYFITSGPIEPPEKAVAQVGSTLRTAIAALVVGGLGTIGFAVAAEAFTRRRAVGASAATVPRSTPDIAAGPAGEPKHDQLHPSLDAGGPTVRPVGDTADRPRSPSSPRRSARKAFGPSDDRPQSSSADSHPTYPKWGDPGAGARADTMNGSRRPVQHVAPAPATDRPEETQTDPAPWLLSFGALTPDNGQEKPTTNRSG
jgi:hypothetical protein